jgi:transcriptional regulator with XRE-family HTH domain
MKRTEIMDRTWLERARLKKGFTQKQVALAAGVDPSYYTRIEKGFHSPDVVAGVKICDYLGVDVHSFLTERPIK